jgi:hypothetical protein
VRPNQAAETTEKDSSNRVPGNPECSECQHLIEMLASGEVTFEDLEDSNDSEEDTNDSEEGPIYQEVPVYQAKSQSKVNASENLSWLKAARYSALNVPKVAWWWVGTAMSTCSPTT